MFRIESNAESVFLNIRQSILDAENGLEENLRLGAVDSVAIIARRVQQQGEGANGSRLETKARLRAGSYSVGYAKRRAERGRQVEHVDLTLSGDLFRSWQVLDSDARQATVGFLDDSQAEKAAKLEEYYGEDIFNLSDSEQGRVADGIADRLMDELNN